MVLTEKQKQFIIKNTDELRSIFMVRIEELKNEAIGMSKGDARDQKIALIQEFLTWLKDIRLLNNPASPPKQPLI